MNLNLAIDQGNSAAKVALFDGTRLVESRRIESLSPEDVTNLLANYNVKNAIYSSVKDKDESIEALLRNKVERYISLSAGTSLPLEIKYDTPNSLGIDRIAAAIGAADLFPQKNLLVIDAGTAMTLDVVNKDGVFLGGNISIGLKMRFDALHNYTARLPLITDEGEIPILGHDTSTAIRAGVVRGMIAEIEGFISNLKLLYSDLTVIMTGGDTRFLVERIKMPIFGDENLLVKGLNRILLYDNESI